MTKQNQGRRTGASAPPGDVSQRTILGWNRVPATRVAMAIRSRWPAKTLTWRAREKSGRLMVRPLRIRAAVGSSAVTEGKLGSSLRGWTKSASRGSGVSSFERVKELESVQAPPGLSLLVNIIPVIGH